MTSLQDKKTPGNALIQSSKGSPAGCSGTRSPECLPLPLRDDAGVGAGGAAKNKSLQFCFYTKTKKKKKTIRCRKKKKKGRGEIGSRTRFSLK